MADRPVFEHLEDELLRREREAAAMLARGALTAADWFHSYGHTPAAQAAADPKENTMITPEDLRALAGSLDTLGTEGLGKATAILGKPETAEGFELLHQLTGLNIDPAIVSEALGGLRALGKAYKPAQAQQAAEGQPA